MSAAELLDVVFLAAVVVLIVLRQQTVLRRADRDERRIRLDVDGSYRRWADRQHEAP